MRLGDTLSLLHRSSLVSKRLSACTQQEMPRLIALVEPRLLTSEPAINFTVAVLIPPEAASLEHQVQRQRFTKELTRKGRSRYLIVISGKYCALPQKPRKRTGIGRSSP